MCARYALFGPFNPGNLVPGFVEHVVNPLAGFAHYNIAPSLLNPVVVAGEGGPGLESMRWGLLPHWAKDPKIAYSTINARAETLQEKPAFRDAWRRGQRCLVPVTGWYEWVDQGGKRKQPYFLRSATQANPMMFAGLWSRWTDAEGKQVATYTVVTTEAMGEVRRVHDRQPQVLPPEAWAAWLQAPATEAAHLLQPVVTALRIDPVGPEVGNPRNQGASLVEPLAGTG